jgi:hypothetical protein
MEGKINAVLLGNPGHIKLDHEETVWEGMRWNHLAQDRVQWRGLVNTIMNLRVPQNIDSSLTT